MQDLHSLPLSDWECIWCDRSPPVVAFKHREHVMPESLGGDRDFRLLRGTVCDTCNGGVLHEIDDTLNRNAIFLGTRWTVGLGSPLKQLVPGIQRDEDMITITPSRLRGSDAVRLESAPGGGTSLTITSHGPSDNASVEDAARGLHRMAFNAIAHKHGSAKTRSYLHLREYVLTGYMTMRAFLIDTKSLNEALPRKFQPKGSWKAAFELLPDGNGEPQVAALRFGMAFFYVSLEADTKPLHDLRRKFPWLQVAGQIDD